MLTIFHVHDIRRSRHCSNHNYIGTEAQVAHEVLKVTIKVRISKLARPVEVINDHKDVVCGELRSG